MVFLWQAVVVYVEAGDQEQSHAVSVSNSLPTVSEVYVSTDSEHGYQASEHVSTLNLEAGADTTIYLYGVAVDLNGCEQINDIDLWDFKVFESGVAAGFLCSLDGNDCAVVADPELDVTLSGCDGLGDVDLNFEAILRMKYWSNATDTGGFFDRDWQAYVGVTDVAGGLGEGTNSFEVASLTAFDVTSSVHYGTLALGAVSEGQEVLFTQMGNREVDLVQTAVTDGLICDELGEIPFENVRMGLANDFAFGDSSLLLSGLSGSFDYDLDLSVRTDELAVNTLQRYLKLRVPVLGVKGTCSGTVTFTATLSEGLLP